jgi:hypothetical protein
VTEFTATELARNEAEEKKLKKIVKQNELKQEKAKEKKQYTGRYNRYASGAVGGSDRYGCIREAAQDIKKDSVGSQVTPRMARPETTGSASTAARRVISSSTAEQLPRTVDQAVAGEEDERDDDEEGGERAVGDIFL